MKQVTVSILVLSSVLGFALSSNINIDGSCPTDGFGCMQCLSRGSGDIESCQQLYFFVNNTNTNNEAEIERYCSGDCPIILATANYYCDSSIASQRNLFDACPGYSVLPTGSFNMNANYSEQHCLGNSGSDRCAECIGERTPEAVRCLQTYLLAQYSNNTKVYTENYCTNDCPMTLSSATWYCAESIFSSTYDICQRNGLSYCIELVQQSESDFNSAVDNCRVGGCGTQLCSDSKAMYGCCLNAGLNGMCSGISDCVVETSGVTQNINIDGDCPFDRHGCQQCLSRNSDELERCEQLYLYLTETTNNDAVKQTFCEGECPILLATSGFYCPSGRSPDILFDEICPGYKVMPSGSVNINANFSGQNCLDSTTQMCFDCINSRSSEPNRCLQLFLLSETANMTEPYLKAFCTSSCPLTFSTSSWYCNYATPEFLFSRCRKMDSNTYCATVESGNQDAYNNAISDCSSDCTSSGCTTGKNMFGCCLRNELSNDVCSDITECTVETAGSLSQLATPFIIALLSLMTHYMIY